MPNIRMMDMNYLDELLEMKGGYPCDFSNRTFSQFFHELSINIDEPKWSVEGDSKGKRLRYFFQNADKASVARVLHALWEYREDWLRRNNRQDPLPEAHNRLIEIIARMTGIANAPKPETKSSDEKKYNKKVFTDLSAELFRVSALDPQARGYEFEKYLKTLFDTFGLKARDAFRIRGEQIDGSFVSASAVYLLEARWQNAQTGAGDLHSFHGKVDQKATWTRGLFVSIAGFTEDGLHAFGRGKKIICMDGLDLSETLLREIPLDEVIDRKVRRASETGSPFVRVRDLF